jgi:lysozyme
VKTSSSGRGLIEEAEGLRLESYQDQRGVWTIGYGHTGANVVKGLVWTPDEADEALEDDLAVAEHAVNMSVSTPLTQNMFDALVSLAYNIGAHAFETSTLLKLLNKGDKLGSASQFLQWSHVDGAMNKGLMLRRVAERDLFMIPEAA